MMLRKIIILSIAINISLNISAQENSQKPVPDAIQPPQSDESTVAQKLSEKTEKNTRSYSINLCLRISDDENNQIVNSSWSRITVSGKPVAINLKANNLQIAAVFIPYYVDDKSVVLLSQGKVMLKPVNLAEGKYYSTVDSLPLKVGEKALFFPLGLLDEKMENISSCVLEIEVQHYDKIIESIDEESIFLEPADSPGQNIQVENNKNIKK